MRKLIRWRWISERIFIFFVTLSSLTVMASDGDVKAQPIQKISEIETFYAKSKDLTVEFEQIETHVLLGKEKKSNGKIYVMGGQKVFWHATHPAVLKVIFNGKKVWMAERDQVFEKNWDELDPQMKLALNLLSGKSEFQKHFKITWKDEKSCAFQLLPKKLKNIEKIELQADCTKKNLKKVRFFFPLERQTLLIFKNFRRNTDLFKKHQKKSLDPNLDTDFNFIHSSLKGENR